MILRLSLFIFYSLFIITPCSGYNAATLQRIRDKFSALTLEIVTDALSKIAGVQHFRDEFYRSTPYQLGEVLCSVNKLLKRMKQIHRRMKQGKIHEDAHLSRLEDCHRYWFEIDHLINMIELWEKKKSDKNSDNVYSRLKGDAGRRYQNLAAGKEFGLDPMEDLVTTQQPAPTQAQRKRKNRIWHAAHKTEFNIRTPLKN